MAYITDAAREYAKTHAKDYFDDDDLDFYGDTTIVPNFDALANDEGNIAVGIMKQTITLRGKYGSIMFDNGVPVMKYWDRNENVASMSMTLQKNEKVIVEIGISNTVGFIWKIVANGWWCSEKIKLDHLAKIVDAQNLK